MAFDLPEIGLYFLLIGLAVLGGLLLLPYLLGPVLIYFTVRLSGNPVLEELSLDDPDLPRSAEKYLVPTVEQLEEEGFELLGVYFMDEFVPKVKNFFALLGKPSTRELVLAAVTYPKSTLGHHLRHVEFSTRMTDGTVIDTSNSLELPAFKSVPRHHVVLLPWIRDVGELYRIHQAAVEYFSPGGTREWRVGDDPRGYFRQALLEEMAEQVETGYFYRDATGDFRPTLKGAILMTYKNLWPITAIRRALRRRRGERLLEKLRV
jgi:hypothetical protein